MECLELLYYRKFFGITLIEAAVQIGDCSPDVWKQYEVGELEIPNHIIKKIMFLKHTYNEVFSELESYDPAFIMPVIDHRRVFGTIFPAGSTIGLRLYQTIFSNLLVAGDGSRKLTFTNALESKFPPDCPLHKLGMINFSSFDRTN